MGAVGYASMPPGLKVHDFHGSAANPAQNGTLRHPDINLVLSHRALEKVDKYRAGYAAQDSCRTLLPAVVSTSGRIHGEFLRLLYLHLVCVASDQLRGILIQIKYRAIQTNVLSCGLS